ncbi:MAG TPA: F0F1 ATP synthase subunit A [Terriglobales bacterium]|nr:F0F1 ATP synthase subunit A [Terriglobales bacterium]
MPEQLPFTALLNRVFGGMVTAFLTAIGVHPRYPKAPIENFLAMEILVVAILFLLFLLVRARLSVDRPGALQHIFESLHGFIENQSKEIIGPHSEMFTSFLALQFIFILLCNLLGLVPGFESPTANPSVPLGCAILAFLYYNMQGIRKQGPLQYAKHFTGPVWWLAWLMLPIEVISHLARMLSLTIRLYANMFAGDMVTLVFFSLVPIVIPVAFLGLHIFVSLLQAYIFTLLTTVYLQGAVATEH